MTERPESLVRWLTWVGILDCICAYAWTSAGRLYGVDCGKGWHRQTTEPACRHHGIKGKS
jgi:hypothetical protein